MRVERALATMNTLGFVGNNMGFAPLIWFDKLTMSGAAGRTMILTIIPLILSLSKEMSRGNQSG